MKPYCIRIAKQKVLTFIIDNLSIHRDVTKGIVYITGKSLYTTMALDLKRRKTAVQIFLKRHSDVSNSFATLKAVGKR
jgi:hypothetical protein